MNADAALLTTRGVLRVVVCPMCACLVVPDGQAAHDAVHAASLRPDVADGPAPGPVMTVGGPDDPQGGSGSPAAPEPLGDDMDSADDLTAVRADDAYIDDLGDGAPPDPDDVLGQHIAAWLRDVDRPTTDNDPTEA